MNRQHFARLRRDPVYMAARVFIDALRAKGVPLRVFVTSDWHSAPAYVYLDLRGVYAPKRPKDPRKWENGKRINLSEKNCKQYARLDKHGIRQAFAWYKKMLNI